MLIALRSLVEMPGMVDPSSAQRAIAKIEDAAGSAAARAIGQDRDTSPAPDIAEDPIAATVRAALADKTALRLTYYSASRDAVSERIVDPVRIVLVDNYSYLQAWCRQAEGVRLFRFDRIDAAVQLDEPADPAAAGPRGGFESRIVQRRRFPSGSAVVHHQRVGVDARLLPVGRRARERRRVGRGDDEFRNT